MIFWTVAGLLALAALAAVVLPVLRARAAARRTADYDIAVYRDQLAEVERNRKRGQIGAAEADAAKAEIGRRILEADQRRERAEAAGSNTPRWVVRGAAALVGVAVPVGALALYLEIGNPGMQAMPLAERDVVGDTRTARADSGSGQAGQAGPSGQTGQGQGGAQAGSLAEAEERLTQRLEEQPGDTDGWILLGRTRLSMGNYQAAVRAFQQAIEREPQSPRVNAMYGEALVMANQGTVVPKAQEAFRAVLERLPDDPRSRFYLGLAAQQAGQPEEALQRWRELVADAPAGAPYLEAVAQRMAAVERELGMEPGSTFAEVEPEGDGGQQRADTESAGSGPTREQMQAAQEMSPEARQQMIENMVEGLRARLTENPNDAQGWQRLIRSYAVLGRRQDAREALASALDAFQDDRRVRRRLIAAARRQDVPLPDGVEPTARAGEGAQGDGGGASGQDDGTRGPTREQMRAAEEMSPEERRAMVESMVQRLAERLENNPDNLQGWLQLARSYETLERREEAVEAYAKAAELAPQDARVLARYAGAIRAREGRQTEESIALSRRVLEIDPENPEALWFTAMAELSEGDRAKARELFDRAIAQLPPDTPQTAELRKRADEMLQEQE